MLADSSSTTPQSGTLNKDVHLPASSIYSLLDFIGDELPKWRDRPDRKSESAETVLTSQLCAHLNSVARCSQGWDILQFRVEERDEEQPARKLDLVPAPCGVTVWIDGRSYSDFEVLIPIECKRLPTPKDNKRDEREYVVSKDKTAGGIQRFKGAEHGGAHSIAAMIGYVQEETTSIWFQRVSDWISELIASDDNEWVAGDALQITETNVNLKTCVLNSKHVRANDKPPIELRHFWLEMH